MQQNRICLNAVNPKIHDSLSEDRLIFNSAGAQPISLKSFRGLGHFPNKIARVYKREHCLQEWQAPVWVLTGFACYSARKSLSYHAGFRKCTYTCCACYSLFFIIASAISLNGNRRQPPPCLPKSETDGRKSMAAQPFILTIDCVRLFCYKIRLIVSRRITMRAPFQILAIPYRIVDGTPMYCVFHRADHDQ